MKITPVLPMETPYSPLYNRHSEAAAISTSHEDPANTASDLEKTGTVVTRGGKQPERLMMRNGKGMIVREGCSVRCTPIMRCWSGLKDSHPVVKQNSRRWGQEENSESGDERKTTLNTDCGIQRIDDLNGTTQMELF